MKMPRSSETPATLKPTARGSSLAGKATVPKVVLVASASNRAPLPMKILALLMDTPSRSPCSLRVPASSGSSTPETTERLTSTVALPKTTPAMLRPALPPMRKVGEFGPSATLAEVTSGKPQFSTRPPLTEVRFNWRTMEVPINWTASTPCNWARPREPSKPVYLRT
ncbi:MAG: hypothetical protein EBU81_07780 [Proteobacteria bacterium]|nr:hypothetical protein [Pseudomonadota bacterium]